MKQLTLMIAFLILLFTSLYSQELSASGTRIYIREMMNKTNGLTCISAKSGKNIQVTGGEFYNADDGYRCTYFSNDRLFFFSLIDITLLDHFELSPNQTEDSPVRFMRIFLNSTSVHESNGGAESTTDYFSFPFLNSGNNYEKLKKAFTHLADVEKKAKPKDPFDN